MKNIDIHKVAEKLLAAAAKISDVGKGLNAITSCMLDVADNAEADDRGLDHASRILAWAGSTGDLASDILDTADDIICAIHDLIGSSAKSRREIVRGAENPRSKPNARRIQGLPKQSSL
jgi:hypothetical protein